MLEHYTKDGKPLTCVPCGSTDLYEIVHEYDSKGAVSVEEVRCKTCGKLAGFLENGEWDKSYIQTGEG